MELSVSCLNGDCLELMKTLPDNSIDLFLCDLPYGCLKTQGKEKNKEGNFYYVNNWDTKIDLEKFWIEVRRLCKNDKTPILMFCNTRFGIDLIQSNPEWFRYDLVWSKGSGTNFLLSGRMPMPSHEMIYVFSKKGAYYKKIDHEVEGKEAYIDTRDYQRTGNCYGKDIVRKERKQDEGKRCPISVINHKVKQDKRHPTAKPIDLLKWLIERYSNEGDTVLDPTAGSFNSGRACVELKRNYIGIEMDKDFYDKNKI